MAEENKKELQEMVADLLSLPRDDLMKTYGFALGLKAQGEQNPS